LLPLFIIAGCSSVLTKVSERIIVDNSGCNTIALTGANVIPMVSDKVLINRTVIIKDGFIQSMGESSEAKVPEDAFLIDARGKYLLPGLVDMHVHISDDNDLLLLLSHGVTTVRNMSDLPGWVKTFMGFSDVLSLRRKVREGKIVGPDIYSTGLVLDGSPPVSPFNKEVSTPEEIEEEIKRQKKAGYGYIKIYDMLTPECNGCGNGL